MRLQRVKGTNGLMTQAHHWPSGYISNANRQVAKKSTPSPFASHFLLVWPSTPRCAGPVARGKTSTVASTPSWRHRVGSRKHSRPSLQTRRPNKPSQNVGGNQHKNYVPWPRPFFGATWTFARTADPPHLINLIIKAPISNYVSSCRRPSVANFCWWEYLLSKRTPPHLYTSTISPQSISVSRTKSNKLTEALVIVTIINSDTRFKLSICR